MGNWITCCFVFILSFVLFYTVNTFQMENILIFSKNN